MPDDDNLISRFHFLIEINPPRLRLLDLGSSNGTKVNGQKLMESELADGDLIKAGKTVFRVAVQAEEVPAADVLETIRPRGNLAETVSLSSPLIGVEMRRDGDDSSFCLLCEIPIAVAALPICSTCHDSAQNPQPVAGYFVTRALGEGGMGVVYLAIREADLAPVALKTIKRPDEADSVQIDRFLREIDVLRRLDHPNIVGFRDAGDVEGLLYFAMDYVPGADAAALFSNCTAALCRSRAPSIGSVRCSRRSTTPTPKGSSIATSSRATCS